MRASGTPKHNPGSLGKHPVDCAPCEAPDGHPLLKDLPRFHVRGPVEKLFEEAYDWARPMTDAECTLRHLVGIDVNTAFAAGADGLIVALGESTHVKAPVFDPKLPGSWLVDLSPADLPRVKVGKDKWAELDASPLPSPFTPKGERPQEPAWYATPTVAYAVELGYDVAPVEAYVRYENGRYLDGWYQRLRDAYLATMAHAVQQVRLAAGAAGPAHGQAQRMPIAESCSMRCGDSIAALLRWLLIHAPSLSSWTSGPSPSSRLPAYPSPPLRTIGSMCLRGTFRWPSRS